MHLGQLEFDNFRRQSPAGWRGPAMGSLGVQNWMQRLRHALCPDCCVQSLVCCPCTFCIFLLPVYLVPIVLPFVSQYAFNARFWLFARHTPTVPGHSLLIYLFLPPSLPCVTLFVLSKLLQLLSAMPKTKSSADFSQRAREKGLQSRNIFNPRPRKATRGHWASGMGRSTALDLCQTF